MAQIHDEETFLILAPCECVCTYSFIHHVETCVCTVRVFAIEDGNYGIAIYQFYFIKFTHQWQIN